MAYYESPDGSVRVELKNRALAALLSWLVPGLGQFYQGRKLKAMLFCFPVLVTFFVGMTIADGKCVYFSMRDGDFRWHYFLQAGVGGPSLPALGQYFATKDGGAPFFPGVKRYPEGHPLQFRVIEDESYQGEHLTEGFMAQPPGNAYLDKNDVLSMWHFEMGHRFDLGTLYTLIAGLINYLVVYDAFAGPAILDPGEEKEEKPDGEADGNGSS